eukprot:TRINITY_DN24751_c0_g1_i1.p1 TRINITY_DN24751_c0_g1~~TRINITY_DN24751_c0_g1_i1.p1  ORF type:complete len:249 (+),score=71.93 TRINITY_DN24751_c0_g1_i1:81-827(+)
MPGDKPAWGKDDDEGDQKPEEMMLPGEVVSRRKRPVNKAEQEKKEDEYVTMDWEDIFPKKPKDRLRWLFKACKAAKEGRVKPNPFYNIIAHRRFLEGLQGAIATDCLNLIRGVVHVFSPKQQKQLQSDNFELFRKYAPIAVLDSDDDEDAAPELPPPPEVHVEMKDKKRKKGRGLKKDNESDDEGAASDDDFETKKARIQSKGVERRIDPADGQAYTLEDFIEQYGGSGDRPPPEWENVRASSFIFRS